MKRPFGKFWLDTFLGRKTMDKFPDRNLTGKTVVFTGGTDGMGRIAVDRFAEMGADICLLGRNLKKTQHVVTELKAAGYKGNFHIVECDLSSLEQVRNAAAEVLEKYKRIEYLINCAGINLSERKVTQDGYEMIFAVNYLATFLLTELLLERIRATPSSRIIHVTSATQEAANLKLDDLQSEKNWSLFKSYSQSKLCVIMHARDIAKRLNGLECTINSLNPGYIQSNLGRDVKGGAKLFGKIFGGLAAPTWVGGERIVAAALDENYHQASGQFIYEDKLLDPNPQALDDSNVEKLMESSRQITRQYLNITSEEQSALCH